MSSVKILAHSKATSVAAFPGKAPVVPKSSETVTARRRGFSACQPVVAVVAVAAAVAVVTHTVV